MDKNIKFIKKANDKHNFKYNYDKAEYISSKKDIIITCLIHGNFKQRPENHLMGKGCPGCGGNKTITTESFIEKSIRAHNNKYDYSLVDIKNSTSKVKIICKKHGVFEQTPSKHYGGSGCSLCGGTNKSNSIDFIKKSILKHDNLYDYSLVNYIGNKNKVKIICKEHGVFSQIPSNHLKGIGCSKCSGKFMDKELFISIANDKHNFKYNYDKLIYINHKTNVEITCLEHGDFIKNPSSHIKRGSGCPKCKKSMSKGEIVIENFLINNKIEYKKQFKFSDLKHKTELKFDFAIFKDNKLSNLIEYNGEQHYKFRGQFGMSLEDFNLGLEKDKKKIDYCINKNINITIIKYDDNIDIELSKLLSI